MNGADVVLNVLRRVGSEGITAGRLVNQCKCYKSSGSVNGAVKRLKDEGYEIIYRRADKRYFLVKDIGPRKDSRAPNKVLSQMRKEKLLKAIPFHGEGITIRKLVIKTKIPYEKVRTHLDYLRRKGFLYRKKGTVLDRVGVRGGIPYVYYRREGEKYANP